MQIDGLSDLTVIGRGGFGVVYRAFQPSLNRLVAVKVLPAPGMDATAVARFERECRAIGSLSGHPHIVGVHGTGVTADGELYLVMELLTGGSLADCTLPMEIERAVRIATELCGALESAHRAGIVHRDVKPGNILLSGFGKAQLVDFGIASLVDDFMSRTGSISGTLVHSAPEVLAGKRATSLSDVYSLGSTLFELLTGAPAYLRPDDESIAPMLYRVACESLPDLRLSGVPGPVATAVERAMAKSPEDRFPSALEMGESLADAARQLGFTPGEVLLGAPSVASTGPTAVITGGTELIPAGEAGTGQITADEQTLLPPDDEVAAAGSTALGLAVPLHPIRHRARIVLAVTAALVLVFAAVALATRHPSNHAVLAKATTGTARTGTSGGSGTPGVAPSSSSPSSTATFGSSPSATTAPTTATGSAGAPATAPPRPSTPSQSTDAAGHAVASTTPQTSAAATTPAVTQPAIQRPFAPSGLLVSDLGQADGFDAPSTVALHFSWNASPTDASHPVTGYRLYRTRMDTSTGPVGGPVEMAEFPDVTSVDFSPSYLNFANSWIQWEVRAVNSAGESVGGLTHTIAVPSLTGRHESPSVAVLRTVGFPVQYEADASGLDDVLVVEDPPGGSLLAVGSFVSIQISRVG